MVITGRKSPLTRYHKAIHILQYYVANNTSTHAHTLIHTHTVLYKVSSEHSDLNV